LVRVSPVQTANVFTVAVSPVRCAVAEETVEHSAYNNITEPDSSNPIDELPLGLF